MDLPTTIPIPTLTTCKPSSSGSLMRRAPKDTPQVKPLERIPLLYELHRNLMGHVVVATHYRETERKVRRPAWGLSTHAGGGYECSGKHERQR